MLGGREREPLMTAPLCATPHTLKRGRVGEREREQYLVPQDPEQSKPLRRKNALQHQKHTVHLSLPHSPPKCAHIKIQYTHTQFLKSSPETAVGCTDEKSFDIFAPPVNPSDITTHVDAISVRIHSLQGNLCEHVQCSRVT